MDTCANPGCNDEGTMACSICKTKKYCGRECQRKDWREHKKVCRKPEDPALEKILVRAAGIAQQAYMAFAERTWDMPILSIEDRGDTLIISEGEASKKSQHFVEFPQKLMTNEQMKMAVLCHSKFDEPLAWMNTILAGLLKGVDVTLEEVELKLTTANIPFQVKDSIEGHVVDESSPTIKHCAFRATSIKTKRQWIFDMTGAQYGICLAFWEWSSYKERFAASISTVFSFGFTLARVRNLSNIEGFPTLMYGINGKAADHLNAAAAAWAKKNRISLPKILGLSDKDFEKHKDSLLKDMNHAVAHFVESGNFTGVFWASQAYRRAHPDKDKTEVVMRTLEFEEQNAHLIKE